MTCRPISSLSLAAGALCALATMPRVSSAQQPPATVAPYRAPVIALEEGGVRETVRGPDASGRGSTGVFFREPTVAALAEAMRRFETMTFDVGALRANAQRFSRGRFLEGMRCELAAVTGEGGFPDRAPVGAALSGGAV